MKKILILSAALVLLAGNAFAFTKSSADGKLTFGASVPNDSSIAGGIGISPKVVAYYVTTGTTTITAQWYAVSTVHPGGNRGYATAQHLNNLANLVYSPGADVATVFTKLPAAIASESLWQTNGWKFE